MRIVFMGSPEFALPSLRKLIESGHEVVAVYTQPDRPTGRGRKLAPPPVKALALEYGLPVRQPRSISKPDAVDELRALRPGMGIIAAYGQILKQPVLDSFPLDVLNVHASLLPRWRGAAPIPAAILGGDAESGATIMRVVLALDAGPMLAHVAVPIAPDDTTATLTPKVAEAGAQLLLDVLSPHAAGAIQPREQDEALATYAPQIEKADALIDWSRDSAARIERMVRAYDPWPIAYSYLDGAPLRLHRVTVLPQRSGATPGTIVASGDGIAVAAQDADVAVLRLQGPGGKPMSGAEYLRGHREILGERLVAER
jgi:methionyl-tRNA formyltransferase